MQKRDGGHARSRVSQRIPPIPQYTSEKSESFQWLSNSVRHLKNLHSKTQKRIDLYSVTRKFTGTVHGRPSAFFNTFTIHVCGNLSAWANSANVQLDYYRPIRPGEPGEDWEWQPLGMSIGAITYRGSESVRRRYVQVPHGVAFPVLAALPVAWVGARLVRRRKARGRGFDVQPNGDGEGR
jgi:hypothetical protein